MASTTRLCERLPHDGNDVLCVDNYFTGRKDNNADLLGDPHFEAMRHDVTLPPYVEIDEVYNLACPASPVHFQYDPVQTTKTSVIGAINMLGLAKQVGAKFLQASTSEVYGDPTVHPQTEEDPGQRAGDALDRPEIPLHTNGSERDIRLHVTKRKVSGGTRSADGRDCRDAFEKRTVYADVKARISARADSAKSFNGSIPVPFFNNSCSSSTVLFVAK